MSNNKEEQEHDDVNKKRKTEDLINGGAEKISKIQFSSSEEENDDEGMLTLSLGCNGSRNHSQAVLSYQSSPSLTDVLLPSSPSPLLQSVLMTDPLLPQASSPPSLGCNGSQNHSQVVFSYLSSPSPSTALMPSSPPPLLPSSLMAGPPLLPPSVEASSPPSLGCNGSQNHSQVVFSYPSSSSSPPPLLQSLLPLPVEASPPPPSLGSNGSQNHSHAMFSYMSSPSSTTDVMTLSPPPLLPSALMAGPLLPSPVDLRPEFRPFAAVIAELQRNNHQQFHPPPPPTVELQRNNQQQVIPAPAPPPPPQAPGLRAGRQRRNRAPRDGKSETIRPPFPWATDRRATVQTLDELKSKQILTIRGDVQCKKCDALYEMEYDLEEKFYEVWTFVRDNMEGMHDRAPEVWKNPVLLTCRNCSQENSARPVPATSKKGINWLFLLLGQLVGCCTLEQLKYFCKHNNNHRTGAKDRLIYVTYITLCKQLLGDSTF